ncbi:hypothetical protein, partial [Herbiconiux daphne]
MNLYDHISEKFIWLIGASACGSVIGVLTNEKYNTTTKRVIYIFGGFCSAFFLAGPVAKYFNLTGPGEIAAVGFAVSIFWQ